jgi:hypothetical protein
MHRALLPLLALLTATAPGMGAERSWSGGDGAWKDPRQWTGATIPGEADAAILAAGSSTVDAPTAVGGVILRGKGSLRVRKELVVGPATGDGNPLITEAGSAVAIEEGAKLTLRRGRLGTITLAGAWALKPGSELELLAAATGGLHLVNTGTLDQRGGIIHYHWTAEADHVRGFLNSPGATWRLTDAATIRMNHEKGDKNGSHSVLDPLRNEGTMRIEGGSTLPAYRMENSGQLTLGDCRLGALTVLRNEPKGAIAVAGEALIGHAESPGWSEARLENGGEGQQGASLRVGDGAKPAVLTFMGGKMSLMNAAACTVEVAAKATIALHSPMHEQAGNHPRGTTIINRGQWLQRGGLSFRPTANPPQVVGINNWSMLRFDGAEVTIERLPARHKHFNEGGETSIFNNRTGVLSGTATVTYANRTEIAVGDRLLVISSGTIAPGTEDKVGTLAFVNADVRFSDTGTGTLAIRVAGPGAADQLALAGEHGGALVLSEEGATLTVTTLPGFAAKKPTTWRIVAAKRVEGAFSATELPKGFAIAVDGQGVVLSYQP